MESSYHYEWRLVHDGIGRVPNVRYDAASFYYNNCLWVTCGGGSGVGKSSEVWKFDTSTKLWSKVDLHPNECPTARDGHSGTYIGNGKFVIFGGQGFSEPNKKLGRESEQLRAQTHCKRDVFNDLWVFDCNTMKWTPIYPDGLSFPMGRRGHSAIYIPKNTLAREEEERAKLHHAAQRHPAHHSIAHHYGDEASAAPSHSSYGTSMASTLAGGSRFQGNTDNHHNNNHASPSRSGSRGNASRDAAEHTVFEPIAENSLVVFGGAGIELSKYTEQLYNDVWVYSFELNTWHKHDTRGYDPHPTTNHRVIRSGENMLIIGGIIGQTPELPGMTSPPPSAGGAHGPSSANPSSSTSNNLDGDIQVLNLRTVTWSVLRILDHAGRPTKLGSLGFSVVPDVDIMTEHMTYLPPKSILVFGGKENVDSKLASTTKQTKRQQMIATSNLPANARRLSAAQKRMLQTIAGKTYAHFHAEGDLLDPWSVTDDHLMLLDIEQCTLTILQTTMEGVVGGGLPVSPPEGRYAHMAVMAANPKEYELEQEKERQEAAALALAASHKHGHGAGGGSRTARSGGNATGRRGNYGNLTSSRSSARNGLNSGAGDFPPEVPVMYLFGGCRLENNGYCDPAVYSLVKVYPPEKSAHSSLTTGRSEISQNNNHTGATSPAVPLTAKSPQPQSNNLTQRSASFALFGRSMSGDINDDDFSRVSRDTNNNNHANFGFDTSGLDSPMSNNGGAVSPLLAPRLSQRGGLLEQSTFSQHNNGRGGAGAGASTSFSMMDASAASIWNNLQKKEQLNNRDHEVKSPNNWDEMKLSLTSSRSLRIVHGQVLGNGLGASLTPAQGLQMLSTASLPVHTAGNVNNNHHTASQALSAPGSPDPHKMMSATASSSSMLLHDFAFRSVASFNRGAPSSPYHNPITVNNNSNNGNNNGSRNNSANQASSRGHHSAGQVGLDASFASSFASPAEKPRSSSSATRPLANSMSALTLTSSHNNNNNSRTNGNKPMSAQSRALAEEARKERIKDIKTTLKPIIGKQTKTIARETYKQLFPAPPGL